MLLSSFKSGHYILYIIRQCHSHYIRNGILFKLKLLFFPIMQIAHGLLHHFITNMFHSCHKNNNPITVMLSTVVLDLERRDPSLNSCGVMEFTRYL